MVFRGALALILAAVPALADERIEGRWDGTYTCAQGLTGFTLEVGDGGDGVFPGVFRFYAVPSNPGVPSGAYDVEIRFYNDRFLIMPITWIDQPEGYISTEMLGRMTPDATGMEGEIYAVPCGRFRAAVPGASPPQGILGPPSQVGRKD